MEKRLSAAVLVGALGLAAAACGGDDAAGSDSSAGEAASGSAASAGVPGQCSGAEWDELVAAAQEEGTVSVLGPAREEVRSSLPQAFQDEFGIEVRYGGGPAADQATQLVAEAEGDVHQQDVLISASGPVFSQLLPADLLGDLRGAIVGDDVLAAENWASGEPPFIDPDGSRVFSLSEYDSNWILINTDEVDPSEVESWDDLLKPEFKGKIVTDDPTSTGPGQYPAAMLMLEKGEDFVRDLYVGQEPLVLTDFVEEVNEVARGTRPIGIGLVSSQVDVAMDQGLPLEIVRPTGGIRTLTGGLSALAILADAPHPNAAALMANWLICAEGNAVFNTAMGVASSRADVVTGNAERWAIDDADDGGEVLNTSSYEFFTDVSPRRRELMEELLG